MSEKEKTITELLEEEFGSTLAGVTDIDNLKEALFIANRVTDEQIKKNLPDDVDPNNLDSIIRPAKYRRDEDGTLVKIKDKFTLRDLILQNQEPQTLMAEIIDAYINSKLGGSE
jgi:hypothetical protein